MSASLRSLALVALAALTSVNAGRAALYTQNFELDDTANWIVNGSSGTDVLANFFFDYNSVGVPAAPSGAGTRGIKLGANNSAAVFGGVSVSPTGVSLGSGQYKLTFDWWENFNGPAPVGGSGSTQMGTFGIGTAGTTAQWPGGTQDSIWFAATGDGNSSSDWRAYASSAPTRYTDTSGVYAAGNAAGSTNANPATGPNYYAGFGGVSAPAAQLGLFPQQTGTTVVGSAGFEWHVVEIEKTVTDVTWKVDGLLIATVPLSGNNLGGSNLFFGHSDTNGTSSSDVNDTALLFTLIDNVRVEAVPEASSVLFGGIATILGGAGLWFRRKAA